MNLNSDMVLEIRSRLPIKSILQCRRVCRLWRGLFRVETGMLFSNLPKYVGCRNRWELYYREQSSPMVSLNLTEEQEDFYKTVTKISTIDNNIRYYHLVGSCNGLVCYRAFEQAGHVLYIFNPITGERIRLRKSLWASLSCGGFCGGFGYCHSTEVYKVVNICHVIDAKIRIQVYTLGDGYGWTEQEFTYAPYIFRTLKGVFANGALHWLNLASNCDIVAFDLTDETFRTLPSPPCHLHSSSYNNVRLGLVGGNLCLCYIMQGKRMDIWVFKKKNMSNCRRSNLLIERTYFNSFTWMKEYSRKWDSCLTQKCQLLSLTGSEILLRQNGGLSCYDRETSKKLWYVEDPQRVVQAIPHKNTLVSLKDVGEELVEC